MPITGRLARQYSYRCDCSDNTQGLKPHEMFTMAVLANANTKEGDHDDELQVNKWVNRIAEEWITPLSENKENHSMTIYEGCVYHQEAAEGQTAPPSKLDYKDNGMYIEIYPVTTNTDSFVETELTKLKTECAKRIEELEKLAEGSDAGKANLEDYLEALKQAAENARPIAGIKIGEYSALTTKDEDGNYKKDPNGYNILTPEKKGADFVKYKNETYWTKGHLETFGFVKVENAVWTTL